MIATLLMMVMGFIGSGFLLVFTQTEDVLFLGIGLLILVLFALWHVFFKLVPKDTGEHSPMRKKRFAG